MLRNGRLPKQRNAENDESDTECHRHLFRYHLLMNFQSIALDHRPTVFTVFGTTQIAHVRVDIGASEVAWPPRWIFMPQPSIDRDVHTGDTPGLLARQKDNGPRQI